MERTFRLKLFAILGAAGLGLLIITIAGGLVERRVDRHLSTIREHYIPKIGLADQLQTAFERVSRRLQDAAQANDLEILEDARHQKTALLEQIVAAREAIDASRATGLRSAIEDYYSAAEPLTTKLIRGENGESTVDDVKAMQGKQALVKSLIEDAAHFDDKGLTASFAAAAEAQDAGASIRLAISLGCLGLVLGLSVWITRGLYGRLADLAAGFRRFGEGDFAVAIPVERHDELGAVARDANQMAERLQKLAAERDRSAWIKAGQVGLADALRGALSPQEVGERALDFLARHLGAPLGAIYYVDPDDVLQLLAGYGIPVAERARIQRFAFGDGLVGEAARSSELTIVRAPAGHLPIRSGLVDGEPRNLVFVPLVHTGKVRGVIELGVMAAWEPAHGELMHSLRDSLTVAIEVARGHAAMRALLDETQRQATELLEARQGLELKAQELARTSTYKSQFLANMSHELRTPLNAILGFSELLHDGAVAHDAPEHKEFLGDIITSGRHLLQLINDILDLSKVEAGKLEFHPEPILLTRTIGEVIGVLRTTAASARVDITSEIDPAIDAIVLDPARLKQVLYNYASNAIKFTGEGGTVKIRALPEGPSYLRIEITDTGIGIAPADLERLFGEFQQIEGDGKRRGGTGLGLALTKRLVEAQGGSVGVRSVVGQGSTFYATYPRIAVPRTPSTTLPPTIQPPTVQSHGPSVLVIEDDARDREDLVEALRLAGYGVEIATSGAQAIERCRMRRFDAITLDLILPDMTGVELLRQLRSEGRNREVPVVVVTVVAEPGAVAGFVVNDILSKPLDFELLAAALHRAVPRRTGTLMIVDDDPTALKLMSGHLQHLGYQTRCETDGAVALRSLEASPPVAIVLDLLMPNMSGFDFLERLRQDRIGRRIPVIVWTSKDLNPEESAMLRTWAQGVVIKGSDNGAKVLRELEALLPERRIG